MPRYQLSLPPACWPDNLRERLERHPLSDAQRRRVRQGMGRWLKIAQDLEADPGDVSRETWLARTEGMSREVRNAIRQALAIAFPNAAPTLYESEHSPASRPESRVQLAAAIARNLLRFPEDWRIAAEPLLHVDPSGVGDGILVQAWAPSTIVRRLEATALHFDFCRGNGLPANVSPASVRAKLRRDQARCNKGERRLGGVIVELGALTGFAAAVRPERSWAWLKTSRDALKKMGKFHGSRNAARAVDAAELRAAGQQLLDKADAAHTRARNRREFVKAHTRARTAVTMILLSEAPIRIGSCAALELRENLLEDLAGLFLDAADTKERDSDRRAFSATLVDALSRYVSRHRAVVARPGETRFLVGERGGPVCGPTLSGCLGDITEPVFEVRVTPHAIRHSVANYIVAQAPEEAALASVILNHRSEAITATYTQRSDQIVASRRLGDAVEVSAGKLGADTTPTKKSRGSRRHRGTLPSGTVSPRPRPKPRQRPGM